jgi:hypothetical protein
MVMEHHGPGFDLFDFIEENQSLEEPMASHLFRQVPIGLDRLPGPAGLSPHLTLLSSLLTCMHRLWKRSRTCTAARLLTGISRTRILFL